MSKPFPFRVFHFVAMGLLALPLAVQLRAQPSLSLKRQGQVDSVQILYPGIEAVNTLIIGYPGFDTTQTNIHDLTPLLSIKKVWGNFVVRNNPRLKDLHGLHNVDTIYSPAQARIAGNDSLESLQGLNNLQWVGSFFYIEDNPRLQSLNGLESLEHTFDFTIEGNTSLHSLAGLESLHTAHSYLQVTGNALSDIYLPNLKRVGTLTVSNEPYLVDLAGLENLDTIGTFDGLGLKWLSIYQNPQLTSLAGLENVLLEHGLHITIEENPSLQQLETLETVQCDSLGVITIEKNLLLQNIYFPNLIAAVDVNIVDNASLQAISLPDFQATAHPSGGESVTITGNPSLTYISMPQLQFVGKRFNDHYGLVIENNGALESLGDFWNLEDVTGILRIADNASLKNLEGIENLKTVGLTFEVYNNPQLTSLCNFTQFDSIGTSMGISGNSLISLDGLQTLRYVGLSFGVGGDSSLADVSALYHLDSVGWNVPISNPGGSGGAGFGNAPSLKKIDFSSSSMKLYPKNRFGAVNCEVLDSLIFPFVEDTESFRIEDNPNLKHLSIPNIQAVGSGPSLIYPSYIRNNASLTSLDGISTITTLVHAPDSLVIRDNPLLWDCEAICRILDRGMTVPWRFHLGGNAFPCNSVEEVEEHICDTLTAVHDQPTTGHTMPLLTMPNPTAGICQIALHESAQIAYLELRDLTGHSVFSLSFESGFTNTTGVDVQQLLTGIYMVRVADTNGIIYIGKLLKY